MTDDRCQKKPPDSSTLAGGFVCGSEKGAVLQQYSLSIAIFLVLGTN
jgi:hypothetical protein